MTCYSLRAYIKLFSFITQFVLFSSVFIVLLFFNVENMLHVSAGGMHPIFSPPSPMRRNTGESTSSGRSAFHPPAFGTSPPVHTGSHIPMAHSGPQVNTIMMFLKDKCTWITVKPENKGLPRERQHIVFIDKWSFILRLLFFLFVKGGLLKCGLRLQVGLYSDAALNRFDCTCFLLDIRPFQFLEVNN